LNRFFGNENNFINSFKNKLPQIPINLFCCTTSVIGNNLLSMNKTLCFLLLFAVQNLNAQTVEIKDRAEVSEYGITWSFAAKTGQFINGDWWVIGPVTIVKITPGPGPTRRENLDIKINRWNDTSLKLDTTMRNGSMIVLKARREEIKGSVIYLLLFLYNLWFGLLILQYLFRF